MNTLSTRIRIGGKPFCAGLFWYPLEANADSAAEQINGILTEQSATFYVTRGKPPFQLGLATGGLDIVAGSVSLAASVADVLSREGVRNFIVAMETDVAGQWCYIAQNQGLLLFDGDFSADGESVRTRISADATGGVAWELIIAPAEWNVVGARNRPVDDLLPPARRAMSGSDFKLKPADRAFTANAGLSKSGRVLVGMALLACVQGGVAFYLRDRMLQTFDPIQAEAQREQDRHVADHPWMRKPGLDEWGNVCIDAVARNAMDVAGWSAVKVTCSPAAGRLLVHLVRGSGATIDDLMAVAPDARLGAAMTEPAVATRDIALRASPRAHLPPASDELLDRVSWSRESSRWSEQWRSRRPQFTPGPTAAGSVQEIAWLLADSQPPVEALALLNLPGSVLESMEFSFEGGKATWTTKASHHVRN